MDLQNFCRQMHFEADLFPRLEPFQHLLWDNSSEDLPAFMKPDFYREYYPLCGGPAPETVYPLMEQVGDILR